MASRRLKSRLSNSPPPDEGWVWITRRMLESYAWRALGVNARRFIDFLVIEHLAHGGKENGRLHAPYGHLEAFGIPKRLIAPAIEEAERLGFVDVKRGEFRIGGPAKEPSMYGLTWLPILLDEREPATDRWLRVTQSDVRGFRSDRRYQSKMREVRRQKAEKHFSPPHRNQIAPTNEGYTGSNNPHIVTKPTPTCEGAIYISGHPRSEHDSDPVITALQDVWANSARVGHA